MSDALEAFVTHPVVFERFRFEGEAFPACDFDDPEAVRRIIGPYRIETAFYDAAGGPVTSARAPGRYAAIVEIRRSGRASKRFATLCRADAARTGVDAEVLEARRAELLPSEPDKWSPVRPGDAHEATLAAGLYDLTAMKRRGETLPADSLIELDRQWWVEFKRRYYGCDKRYPKEFVCPGPIAGSPAPVVRRGSPAEAGMKPDAVETIRRECEAWVAGSGIGCGLCVVRHGVVVIDEAWGVQAGGPQKGEPFTVDTPAPLASTTKFLSAILLSEFADQGLIGIDEPVDKYVAALRGIAAPAHVPTVRDLFLHTAGFTGHWGDSLNDIEEVVADLYPALDVWKTHRYQGVGHALAGKVMEMISGESVPRLFRRHLFGPLGAKSLRSNHTSYGSRGTAQDLALIGQMMLNGGAYGSMRFTSPDAIAQLMPIPGRDRFDPDRAIRWGVGSKLFDSDGLSERHYGHSGAGGCFLKVDPAHDMVLAHTRHAEDSGHGTYHRNRAKMIASVLGSIA